MTSNTYELTSPLSAEAAMQRIEDLLATEGVHYKTGDLSISSISTPVALLGIERNFISKKNWVGLNPFTFVTAVEVRFESNRDTLTKIIVDINQSRAVLWVGCWAASAALAAATMPMPLGAIVFVGVTSAAWFGFVSLLAGSLIRKEIRDCLDFQ